MKDQKPEPNPDALAPTPRRVGHIQAMYIAAIREKYGRYPKPAKAKPLPGKKNVVVPEIADYASMKPEEYFRLAVNRADERRRLNPTMPRFWRKANWTSERQTKENLKRKPQQ